MSDESTILYTDSSTSIPHEEVSNDRRLRWFELSLVVLIAIGGSFITSLNILLTGRIDAAWVHNLRWASGLFHQLTCLALLGYVLSRRKLQFTDLGLRWSFRDLGSGLLVAFASYWSYAIGYYFVHSVHGVFFGSGTSGVSFRTAFANPTFLAIPFALINPFFEELVVRAYLMTELKDLTGSWLISGAASLIVQTSYHLYYGWVGALSLSFQFLVFTIYFARTRKATPVIVAHGIFDLWALLRIW